MFAYRHYILLYVHVCIRVFCLLPIDIVESAAATTLLEHVRALALQSIECQIFLWDIFQPIGQNFEFSAIYRSFFYSHYTYDMIVIIIFFSKCCHWKAIFLRRER